MELVALLIIFFIIVPLSLYLMGRKEEKKANNEKKRSNILFNSTIIERNVTAEEVFEALNEANISPDFLQNKSN